MLIGREQCHVCGGRRLAPFAVLDHRQIARCADCGYLFARRYDEQAVTESYRRDYYAGADDPRIGEWLRLHQPVWQGLVADLARFCPQPSSLLDIGSGTGGFLLAYHERFPEVPLAAIESSEPARAFLQGRLPGLRFPAGDAAELASVDETFDAVTLLQTLEHVRDPDRLCRDIHDRLNPGGVLLVTVPNSRSYKVLWHGRRDVYTFNHPTHLQFFSRSTLSALLRRSGFAQVVRVVGFGGGQVRGAGRIVQWLCRWLGISTELRYVARKPGVARPTGPEGRG